MGKGWNVPCVGKRGVYSLLNSDLCTIAKFDTLDGPNGIQLFENENDNENENEIENKLVAPSPNDKNIENKEQNSQNNVVNAAHSSNQQQTQILDLQDEILNDPLDNVIANFPQNQKIDHLMF